MQKKPLSRPTASGENVMCPVGAVKRDFDSNRIIPLRVLKSVRWMILKSFPGNGCPLHST